MTALAKGMLRTVIGTSSDMKAVRPKLNKDSIVTTKFMNKDFALFRKTEDGQKPKGKKFNKSVIKRKTTIIVATFTREAKKQSMKFTAERETTEAFAVKLLSLLTRPIVPATIIT